jgi:hypothetical protein
MQEPRRMRDKKLAPRFLTPMHVSDRILKNTGGKRANAQLIRYFSQDAARRDRAALRCRKIGSPPYHIAVLHGFRVVPCFFGSGTIFCFERIGP